MEMPRGRRSGIARWLLLGMAGLVIVSVGVVIRPDPAGAADIFQIEIRHCSRLHVGYKNFPPATVVRWRVTEPGRADLSGQFVTPATKGFHFLTTQLSVALDPAAKARISFSAALHGREYHLTIVRRGADRRNPVCAKVPGVQARTVALGRPPGTTKTSPPPDSGGRISLPNTSALAFTGNGLSALFGAAALVLGAMLLLLARRMPPRHVNRRRLVGPAPWLWITPNAPPAHR
jgi:hypothetical protein